MQPNTPLDYLNQIAPEQPKPLLRTLKPIHYIIGGVVILLILILVIGLVSRAGGGTTTNMEHLLVRLQTTAAIAEDATASIKSNDLSVVNTNLNLYLTQTNADIVAPFKNAGVTSASIDKTTKTDEAGTELATRLEDARLNAVYDSTYAREMAYQLSTILTLMKSIYQSTGNAELKEFLEASYAKLAPTQESFQNFSTVTD